MTFQELQRLLGGAGVGAGLGALGLGGASYLASDEKDPSKRRADALHKAILGAGLGGVGGAGLAGYYNSQNPLPSPFGKGYSAFRGLTKNPVGVGAAAASGTTLLDILKQHAANKVITGEKGTGGLAPFSTAADKGNEAATYEKLVSRLHDISGKTKNLFTGNRGQGFADRALGLVHPYLQHKTPVNNFPGVDGQLPSGLGGGAVTQQMVDANNRSSMITRALNETGLGQEIPFMEKLKGYIPFGSKIKDLRSYLPQSAQKGIFTPANTDKGYFGLGAPRTVTELLRTEGKNLPLGLRGGMVGAAAKGGVVGLGTGVADYALQQGLNKFRDDTLWNNYQNQQHEVERSLGL